MAKKSKPRKKSRFSSSTAGLVNLVGNPVWRALNKKPLNSSDQLNVALKARAAFDEIERGTGEKAHTNELSTVARVAIEMSQNGNGIEFLADLTSARAAVRRVRLRAQECGRYYFEPHERHLILLAIELYQEQITTSSKLEMGDAIADSLKRLVKSSIGGVVA